MERLLGPDQTLEMYIPSPDGPQGNPEVFENYHELLAKYQLGATLLV